MTKNKIIALLIVLLILSTAFGLYQKKETDKFEALADENEKVGREAALNAEKQMMLAQELFTGRAMALDRLQNALTELQTCKKRK